MGSKSTSSLRESYINNVDKNYYASLADEAACGLTCKTNFDTKNKKGCNIGHLQYSPAAYDFYAFEGACNDAMRNNGLMPPSQSIAEARPVAEYAHLMQSEKKNA